MKKLSKHKVLSKRNKEMVREYATNPKLTKTDAYELTHKVGEKTTRDSVLSQASEAFRNPLVKSELSKYSNLSEETVIDTIEQYRKSDKQWERILANDNAKWTHDKIHGKATQRVETHNTTVNLNLSLADVTDSKPV